MKKLVVSILLCATLLLPVIAFVGCSDNGPAISKTAQTYNIVFTNATVPVSMASMDIWTSENETYFWYSRRDTFQDLTALKKKVHLVGNAGKKNMTGLPNAELKSMANKINQIYKVNKNNKFKLYVVDYGLEAAMKFFYGNGIPEANFEVILCSDGDGSYNEMREFLNGDNQTADMNATIAEVDNIIKDAKSKRYNFDKGFTSWHQSFAYATKDNVKLWLQRTPANDGGAQADGKYSAGRFAGIDVSVASRMNIARKDLFAMANEMKTLGGTNSIDSFKQAMFGDVLSDMFKGKDGKKPLIITGTSFDGETDFTSVKKTGETSNLETAFNKIKAVYGDEYFFIYKGHPAWPTHEGYDSSVNWKRTAGVTENDFNNRVAYIESAFDFEIPAQIPADMIMLFYQDEYALNFGGYDSSLFAAADRVTNLTTNHTVLFFIGALGASNSTALSNGNFDFAIGEKTYRPQILTVANYATYTDKYKEVV